MQTPQNARTIHSITRGLVISGYIFSGQEEYQAIVKRHQKTIIVTFKRMEISNQRKGSSPMEDVEIISSETIHVIH